MLHLLGTIVGFAAVHTSSRFHRWQVLSVRIEPKDNSWSRIMELQMCIERRVRLGWVLSVAFVGAGAMNLASAAVARDSYDFAAQSTFAAGSRSENPFAIAPEDGSLKWSFRQMGAAYGADDSAADIYRSTGNQPSFDFNRGESFSDNVRQHHGGGGREGDGEFGDDHDHDRCDDHCTISSAVPEPTSNGLAAVGALALLAFLRWRRGGAGLFAPR